MTSLDDYMKKLPADRQDKINKRADELRTGLDASEVAYPEVSKGVEWFDQNQPGWHLRVNLATLNVADISRCVACQVSGVPDFHKASVALFGEGNLALMYEFGIARPSSVKDEDRREWFASATRLWKQVVEARLGDAQQ